MDDWPSTNDDLILVVNTSGKPVSTGRLTGYRPTFLRDNWSIARNFDRDLWPRAPLQAFQHFCYSIRFPAHYDRTVINIKVKKGFPIDYKRNGNSWQVWSLIRIMYGVYSMILYSNCCASNVVELSIVGYLNSLDTRYIIISFSIGAPISIKYRASEGSHAFRMIYEKETSLSLSLSLFVNDFVPFRSPSNPSPKMHSGGVSRVNSSRGAS